MQLPSVCMKNPSSTPEPEIAFSIPPLFKPETAPGRTLFAMNGTTLHTKLAKNPKNPPYTSLFALICLPDHLSVTPLFSSFAFST